MTVFLDTSRNTILAIAICDRCKMKFPWGALGPDPNFPGLRVCRDCADVLDPYRLPSIVSENVSLRWARPDTALATSPNGIITEDDNYFLITEDGERYLVVG